MVTANFIKEFVNGISSPAALFTLATGLLFLFLMFPKQFTSPKIAILFFGLIIGFFFFGLTDPHFREIVTTPDNVPIVGMFFLMIYLPGMRCGKLW